MLTALVGIAAVPALTVATGYFVERPARIAIRAPWLTALYPGVPALYFCCAGRRWKRYRGSAPDTDESRFARKVTIGGKERALAPPGQAMREDPSRWPWSLFLRQERGSGPFPYSESSVSTSSLMMSHHSPF